MVDATYKENHQQLYEQESAVDKNKAQQM